MQSELVFSQTCLFTWFIYIFENVVYRVIFSFFLSIAVNYELPVQRRKHIWYIGGFHWVFKTWQYQIFSVTLFSHASSRNYTKNKRKFTEVVNFDVCPAIISKVSALYLDDEDELVFDVIYRDFSCAAFTEFSNFWSIMLVCCSVCNHEWWWWLLCFKDIFLTDSRILIMLVMAFLFV